LARARAIARLRLAAIDVIAAHENAQEIDRLEPIAARGVDDGMPIANAQTR
jgi:hypothetical protein